MKQAAIWKSIRVILLTSIALFIASVASAQTGRIGSFRRVPSEPFSGNVTITDLRKASPVPANLRSQTINLNPAIQKAWHELRTILTDAALKILNERDIGEGFRTSRNEINLAENGELFFATDGSGFSLKFVLRNNTGATSFRIPGPSPGSIDPRVAISCDADVTIEVDRIATTIKAKPALLNIDCRRPTGVNLTGKVGIGVARLIDTLGGPDFIGQLLAPANNDFFALNKAVNRDLSETLRKYTGDKINRGTIIGVSRDKNRVILTLEDDDVDLNPGQTGTPAPPAPKPPFITASQPIFLTPTLPIGSVYLGWDGGPDHPNAEVWVSINSQPEIPASVLNGPLFKQPKISGVELKVPRGSGVYKYFLKDAGTTLSTVVVVVP